MSHLNIIHQNELGSFDINYVAFNNNIETHSIIFMDIFTSLMYKNRFIVTHTNNGYDHMMFESLPYAIIP